MKNYLYIAYRNGNQNSEVLMEIKENTLVTFEKDDKYKFIKIDDLTMKHRKHESICVIRYKESNEYSTLRYEYGIIYVDEGYANMFGGNYEISEFKRNGVGYGVVSGHQAKMNYLIRE